jgi:cytochrome c oxidase subunit II
MGRKIAVAAAALAAFALACAPLALAGDGGLAPPPPTTESGEAIKQLYWFVFAICAVVFVLVESALVLFIIRFRRRGTTGPEEEGPQIHGNTRLEIIWTIIPAVILVVIAAVVFVRVPVVEATSVEDDENALRVDVEAHQFYWQYEYGDEGPVSVDTLFLPVNRPVELRLTSLDVDHSWWVPELTGKRDAIPGRTTTLRFTPLKRGTYEGKCAELCGILHTVMPTEVRVVSQTDYDQFVAGRENQDSGDAQLELGRETWNSVCADCHGPQGEGDIGPPIQGNGTLTNPQALRDLMENGQNTPDLEGYMPGVGRDWPDFQLEALMAYIQSDETLAGPQTQGGGGQGGG